MANSLIVMPYVDDPSLREWVEGQGAQAPDTFGTAPDRALLERIVHEVDWPYHENPPGPDGALNLQFQPRDERWPPISDLTMLDGAVGFRLGAAYGPFHVAREIAKVCGPQIAVEGGSGNTCVVLPDTTYEDFHLRIHEVPPREDGRDRLWSEPPTEAWKWSHASPEEWPDTPEEAFEYAVSGRRGHAQVASSLGRALRDHRDGREPARPADALDDARHDALVERLREHLRVAELPSAELVIALAGVEGAKEDLLSLAARLEGVDEARSTREIAEALARRL